MNITTTTTEPSTSTLPQPDIYTAISLLSISTFTCLLLYYLIFDLSFFTLTPPKPRPSIIPTTTILTTTITTTTTLLSTTFTTLLLFNLPPNNPAIRITSAILLVLTTTTSSISNTLLLYFSLPLITIHQEPSAYFHLKTQRFLLYGIIASILLFQLPHVIVAPAAATLYKDGHWSHAVTILERISVTAYCGREILLLGCYAWGVVRFLRPVVHYHYKYYQSHTGYGHGNGRQLLYTLLMAGCVSLILNIANIVAVYVVHTAAAMAFFPFVVSTKVLVEVVAVGRLVGFVGGKSSSLQYYYQQQNSIYSVTGCGSGSQSRRGSMQPLIMQRGSVAMMSGGVGSSVGEGKDGGGSGVSEGEGSPGGTWAREKEWWYRSRMGSVDTVVSVAEPPVAHSAEHLVQEVVDLKGGAGVGVSRRTSVV
ncbi:hypothetical protein AtubIFM61612_002347 [Aspergillus tubingensis]|uniref:Unnamed protein product n=1 Tax=Aspergillus niger TaxID=5061 RepID=A0A100IKH3_ASPNG|nr:unnamed protein product [Aspergillus niger]GLA90530.1 hypothetical protein AtubIFM57143_000135 [Aspergillus tubingensis]GLB21797.1 hypothetical protein AtubIFM61612_002347 [Aspergillus tubingensis]